MARSAPSLDVAVARIRVYERALDGAMINRRDTLKQLAGAAGSIATASFALPAQPVASRIIDTHTHFYDPTRPQGVPWPTQGSPLYRPVYPKDWAALSNPLGIRETIVVEASKWLEDNDWLLNLAASEKAIVGCVGHLTPGDAGFEKDITRLASNPLFRGIRVSGQELTGKIASPEFVAGCELLAAHDLSLDVNGFKDPAPVAALAAKVARLRIVIDHCGGCGDPKKLRAEWKAGMAACAQEKGIFVKVSALMEMADAAYGKAPAQTGYYLPVLDFLWDNFGPDHLMYASNWPVSDKGGSYADVFGVASGYVSAKGPDAAEKFFWKTSLAAYKWRDR